MKKEKIHFSICFRLNAWVFGDGKKNEGYLDLICKFHQTKIVVNGRMIQQFGNFTLICSK